MAGVVNSDLNHMLSVWHGKDLSLYLGSTLLITDVSNLPGIMQLHHHWSCHTKHAKMTLLLHKLLLKMHKTMTHAVGSGICQAIRGAPWGTPLCKH